jgi:signal transduction histidine kinase
MVISRDITDRRQAELNLVESRKQLRGLIAHREDIREEERKHIAREVHDELGQILSGLKLNIDLLASQYPKKSKPLDKHLQETRHLVSEAVKTVRNIASSLRPIELDMGIVYALNILVDRFGTYTGIQCKVHVNANILAEDHAIILYRIIQEALTNVAKHAKADAATISLISNANGYTLNVCDNGRGFDPNEHKPNSFGLLGIQERVNMLGGTVTVTTAPNEGTEIAVHIPITNCGEQS